MKRWGYVIVLVALGAGACWQTKNNPAFGHDGGVDGGPDGSVDMATGCTKDSECTAAAPACDIPTGKCGPCTSSTSCSGRGATLTCDTSTGAQAGQCVGCVKESDCATAGQACVADACVTCTQNSDCENGICDTGKCIGTADIIYVDNVTCLSAGTPDGKADATAYCQIGTALGDVNSVRKYVRVAGTGISNAYDAIVWNNGPPNVVVVGPGKSSLNGAYVKGTSGPAVDVSNPSSTTMIALDGLLLQSQAAATVSCLVSSGSVTVKITDSSIHDGSDVGIQSTKCSIKLLQSIVTGNRGGVSLTNSSYDIENSFIVQNASTVGDPGVYLDMNSSGTFAFNTVSRNTTATGAAGGINCQGTNQTITNSIVFSNTSNPVTSGTQFGGSCKLVGTVTGPDAAQANTAAPQFAATTDYHLMPDLGLNTCCIDVADMGPPVNVDIDDEKRPKGLRYDVGADEAR